jgi:ribosome-binding factor A
MKGQHLVRVRDQIKRILSDAIREEVRDPAVGFVTLTDVQLSPDLSHAIVFVTSLEEDPKSRESVLDGLSRATPFLRRQLARKANLRRTPQIRFDFDDVAESGSRLEALFAQMRDERPPSTEES